RGGLRAAVDEAAHAGFEQHLGVRFGVALGDPVRGQGPVVGAVVDPGQVAGAVVADVGGVGGVLGVLVGLFAVPVRHGVAAHIDDVVQVPPPGLHAVRGGEH